MEGQEADYQSIKREPEVTKTDQEIGIPIEVTNTLSRAVNIWKEFRNPGGHFEKKKNEWAGEIKTRLSVLRGDSNNPPDISVVIPAHNEERYILQVLDSISKQQTKHTLEVIVVDNNSRKIGDRKRIDGKDFVAVRKDLTSEIARECGAEVVEYHEDTEAEKSPKIAPIASAKQVGTERAKGKIIITADADTIVTPTWAEALTKPFIDTRVSLVASDVDYYRGPHYLTPLLNLFNKFNRRRIFYTNPETNLVAWSNMAFRKDDHQEFGGWNTQIPIGEDFAKLNEMRKHGKLVFADPKLTTVYVSSRRLTGISRQDMIDEATGKDPRASYLTKPETDGAHNRYFRHITDKYLYPDEAQDWKYKENQNSI